MKLYVIRHGQTDWNAIEKLQGKTDTELNETGINQASQAKEEFDKLQVDLIIASPLKRTKRTAEIINENKKLPLFYDERLMERCFGDAEGTFFKQTGIFKKVKLWDYNENSNYQNAEPVVDLCKRVWSFLDEVKEKYSDKNVLLVTHGGTMRTINAYFNGIQDDGMFL